MNYFDRLEAAKTAEYVVFIGYDPVEDVAAKMLARSIRTRTSMKNLNIIPILLEWIYKKLHLVPGSTLNNFHDDDDDIL